MDVGADHGERLEAVTPEQVVTLGVATRGRSPTMDAAVVLPDHARVRVEQPRLPTATWEVTELEPGRSYTWASPAPGLQSVAWHAVEPLGAGRSRVTLGIRQTGPLGVVATLMGPLTRRYVDTEIAGGGGGRADYVRTSVRCTLWWSSG